jgi:TM2 domain-containing membrane protein YozV
MFIDITKTTIEVTRMNLSMIKRLAPSMGLLLLLGLTATDAMAQNTIASTAATWKLQIQAMLGIAKLILGLVGFFMFSGGLFYFYKDNKQPGQGHVKTGVIALFVGTSLMIIPWLLSLFTESVANGQGTNATTMTSGSV